jgi:hypothetical protein
MSIVLVGSTSGSVTLQEPAVAGTTVLDLPAVSGTVLTTGTTGQVIASGALPIGSVLQVVNASLSTYASLSISTFSDTGLTATITPKFATSKVLVCLSLSLSKQNNTYVKLKLLRNGSDVVNLSDAFAQTGGSVEAMAVYSANYLDSPASTSALTYKVQYASGQNIASININNYIANNGNTISTITLMEIAA